MKIKTSELIGRALDWAVGTASGAKLTTGPITSSGKVVRYEVYLDPPERDEFGICSFNPSEDWSKAGPIIECEQIGLVQPSSTLTREWGASKSHPDFMDGTGPTPLVAAMRCHVASKLGEEVDIPEELCRSET